MKDENQISSYFIAAAALAFVALAAEPALAAGTGTTIVAALFKQLAKIIHTVAVVLAWGLGFVYIVMSVRDFVHSDDGGYQLRRQASNKLMSGICLLSSGQIIDMLCSYLGIEKIW